MKQLMGVINLDHELELLGELTYFRCGAAVPFAGRYRLIDFVMSNMMHAGVLDIALFVRRKYRSLLDHLGEGRPWDLDRKRGGLFILPPDWNDPTDVSSGEMQHIHNNQDFFERGSAEYVIYSGSQHLSNVDFCDAYAYHLEQEADVTLIYTKIDRLQPEHQQCIRLDVDENGRVTDIHHEREHSNIYMEMFIMEKRRFLHLAKQCIAHGESHFFRDAIHKNRSRLKIAGYEYKGYHAVINSLESYYRNSMDLLQPEKYNSLFREQPVHTKIKYEVPARYLQTAEVSNSLVANGCQIGGTVENSILFRGVQVKEGARIHNSIIMQKCVIHGDVKLENVILDKDVIISRGRKLQGDVRKPFVVAKDTAI
ncbi:MULTISPECIES: glucose-1-phosphate adenylyltransferase subunit GlgD [Paenibacillus]|uniref:Glucose-1-phosphate adenylyltransferase subunit GlgD n=1 Tax=Paenibacillus azoreducens TaxID=116718 RepID=A0A919YH56_9BACL|nr:MULTISPECIES: glucose-1-phosphate adenylyltransferase subunit GlgD [Paenibacillus]MBE9916533.1 glucose-1-phosphate adenylyltransferase subunit GlgD [Paenibacillus donghaensis]GIO50536.1 glucose-1-phosphate adenylyltransferase subunit GlgD [Paenibacillus azoreducens]